MDLILLVLGLAVVGFLVYLITTKIPMDPMFVWTIRIIVLIVVVLYLIRVLGVRIPNMM